ncbi:hypothetical protein NP493_429g00004 [Ridgeia piscesae]|uniref:Uncharacterized protein n=1 Tax=Ridgeia piscesae TaxID=27915 RepID=A0AAD9L015_RIDPI|nr:hypothetical protein NP493_429g00004 [Ridgeia piscesae]
MIADTATGTSVLSTSPWSSGQDSEFNQYATSEVHSFDRGFVALEAEIERLKTLSDVCYERCHVSCGASVTSSEASTDEFCVDDDVSTSLFPVVEDQEYLSLNVFEMGTLTEHLDPTDLATFGWSDSEESSTSLMGMNFDIASTSDVSDTNKTRQSTQKRRRHSEPTIDTNRAEEVNEEQLHVVEQLMTTIREKLDLREQLEVIRIIDPDITIVDTELVVDLACLSEEKLRQVKEYVLARVDSQSPISSAFSSSSSSSSNCDSASSTTSKKQTKKQRRQEQRESRQRQRKEYRQVMKERRSGLFRREQVLSLTSSLAKEVEDVDILT